MSYPFTTAYLQLPKIPNTPFPSQLYVFLSYNSLGWVSAAHACTVCTLGPEQPPRSRILREEWSICQRHQLSIIPLIGVDLEVGGSLSHAGSLTNPTFNVPFQPKWFSLHKTVRALHSLSLVEFSESRKGQQWVNTSELNCSFRLSRGGFGWNAKATFLAIKQHCRGH